MSKCVILCYRGNEFKAHGMHQTPSAAVFCNACCAVYPWNEVTNLLDQYLDTYCPVRDITCCQGVVYLVTGVLYLQELLPKDAPQSDEPKAEEPAPAPVCRWCKGARKTTFNFKTKPCDCVKEKDGTVGPEDVGVSWRINKTFNVW